MNTADFLKEKVSVFKDFTTDRLRQLVEGAQVRSFEANEVLVRQGSEAAHFVVVLKGTVAASVPEDGGVARTLGRLGPGETFGELALMTGDAVLADFIAESSCEVLLI